VSASPQLFCFSNGTVIFIHELPPFRLALPTGAGELIHIQFSLPEAAGQRCGGEKCPAAFSICPSPHRDRLRAVFCFSGVNYFTLREIAIAIDTDRAICGRSP
jgi:hypothetical protein